MLVGVMNDEDLKLEEIEVSHTLGGEGEVVDPTLTHLGRSYSDTLGYTNLDRRKVEGVSVMKDKDWSSEDTREAQGRSCGQHQRRPSGRRRSIFG